MSETPQLHPGNGSDELAIHYSGPSPDERDPVRIGEMLWAITGRIEAAARENPELAAARGHLRDLLDPKFRGEHEVSDQELGDAIVELGKALGGREDITQP